MMLTRDSRSTEWPQLEPHADRVAALPNLVTPPRRAAKRKASPASRNNAGGSLASQVRNAIFGLIFFVISLASAGWVSAATFNVNTFSDTHAVNPAAGTGLDSTGKISLRSALEVAQSIGGTQTINLPAGTYNLSLGRIVFGDVPTVVTIAGASAATTIVNMTTTAQDRIFLIGTTGTQLNVHTSISNVQFIGGKLTSDDYGGGAIIAGGPNNSLTLTNCIFQNNTIDAAAPAVGGPRSGGAVRYNGGGSLTITGSVFNNNSTTLPGGVGGAVSYFLENLASAGSGAVTITNSTFTNNSVTATGSTGGALDVSAQGRLTAGVTFAVSILRNTFSGNSASGSSGSGGAISVTNSFDVGNTAQVNYNRIVGNTSNVAPSAMAVAGGSQGSVDATDNWWGVNTGPGTTAAKLGAGGGPFSLGTWLQLKTTAGPNPIVTNQSSSLTTSFLSNSSGGAISSANLTALIGQPVTWSGIGGTVTGQQTTIQAAGTATATYNETTGVAGTHSATAVVDSGPASGSVNTVAFTVNKANVITTITSDTPDPTVTGQAVTVNYTAAGSSGNSPTVPTGNVSVSDGINSASGTVAAGSAAVTLFTAGARTLTATYPGDANFNASPASAGAPHQVNKAGTTVTITSDTPDPSNAGQAVTVNYTVSVSAPGSGTPTGNVTISDASDSAIGSLTTGSVTLNNAGNRTLTATYNGDAKYNASAASPGAAHVVRPVVTLSAANIPTTASTVTINGAGFSTTAANNSVAFSGGATGTVSTATATQLTVTGVAGLTVGNLTAIVTTNTISSGAAVQVATVVAPPPPTVTAISPTAGPTAGGTLVMITGTNFTGANGVTIGGAVATGLTITATSITATAPAHAAGTASVVVTTPGGGSNAANTLYTYVAPPTLAASKLVSVDNGTSYSASSSAPPGTSLIYKIIASNTSTASATQVQFIDALPAGVTIVAGSGKFATATATTYASATGLTEGAGGYAVSAGSVAYNPGGAAGSVAASGTLVLFFKVTINNAATGTLTNNVTVNYNDAIGNAQTPATGSAVVAVQKANQTLSFGAPPAAPFAVDGTATVVATSANPNSGNAITFTSLTTAVCSVNSASGLVTGVTIGTCTIAANQLGNAGYNPAAQVTQSFSVSAACNLDINGDSGINADKDGVLLSRYLLGFRGASLIANVPLGLGRADAVAVENFIGTGSQYDAFGRTALAPTAHRDGIVLVRLMLGVPDASLLGGLTVPAGAAYTQGSTVRANVNRRCGTTF